MKRPNKIERMNAYLYAWAILTGRIEDPYYNYPQCLCYILCDYVGETLNPNVIPAFVIDLFPELKKQAPTITYSFWWPAEDKQSRITALENAIKLLA